VLATFRLIFLCAMVLSLASAGLVTASLFMKDRAPETAQFLGISLAVIGIFLTLGLLLFGIQKHVAGIARLANRVEDQRPPEIEKHVFRLMLYLSLGGAGLGGILAILTYAILARIDQGFAVFG
jgi:hypothetical protein